LLLWLRAHPTPPQGPLEREAGAEVRGAGGRGERP
jgi:hypothetical protein